jgi:YegS/Rv2252/BmrU family lipid kinase
MPAPLLVILNPWAGRGRGAKARHLVQRGLRDAGVPYEIVETTGPGHAIGITREAVAAGVTRIIAASGDGTIHEVANALLDMPPTEDGATPAAVGCIPLGTGNDFAKLVGVYGLPPEVAAARMVHAETDVHDAGQVLGEWFDNIFGVGFDAETVRNANKIRRLKGVAVYLAAIYRTFLTFRPPMLEVISAEHHETSAMMMLAANIGVSGGGKFYLTPQADPRDGLLDVCLIRSVGVLTFLTAVPKVMKGTHTALDEVTLFQTTSVTVRSADGRPLLIQLDGELREPHVTEVTVTIAPRRLRVLHPR